MKRTADVVIVGGGCMGASLAYHLAERGLTNVVIVERESGLGLGSTGRNAGGVRHQFSTRANIQLSIESIQLFEHWTDIVGSPMDFHQDGYLFLLSSPDSVTAFRESVAMQREMGVAVDWLEARDAEQLAAGLSADGVLGATFCRRDGIADPHGVTSGFARSAQSAGVTIQRDTEVTGIRSHGGRVLGVTTTRGEISTAVVVNAAGPQAASIGRMADIDVPIRPFPRHIFIAKPSASGWRVPDSHIMVIDFDTTFYFHREGAGILFGMGQRSEIPSEDLTVDWSLLERTAPVAARRLPALSDAPIARAWAGLYEMTPDANPIIGPVADRPGLYVIAGFSGHGFQHAPAAGRILADVITGRDPRFDLSAFSLSRFAAGHADSENHVV